jgi:hypothetical protein
MGGFKLANSRGITTMTINREYDTPEKMFALIQDSTYIENVNRGVAQQVDHFGAKTQEGMAYSKNSMYNGSNKSGELSSKPKANSVGIASTAHADATLPQSNSMNPKRFL